ncbi:MAG: PilZ domain-containing protein, partial [bacterium]
MPFVIRPYRRFPLHCAITYHAHPLQGQGTVWNFSMYGWKFSGDVPLSVGQTCPLTVTLPNQEIIFVTAAIVRWVRGQEYGLETLAIDKEIH